MNRSLEETIRIAEESTESFSRNVSCKVYGVEEGALAVSRFVDLYHDITLVLLVDRKTFCILDTRVTMDKVPYEICRDTQGGVASLKGLSIYHRAVNREVRRRIPRKEGCTHLFELIEFTLGCLFSGAPQAGLNGARAPRPIEDMDPEEHRRRHLANPWLKNTCKAFATDKKTKE